ncbi:MAG: polysaccharide deacetylase family protein [Syntrophomonadaceae bacterium]|nr:polysaccharide deacetylase family protein [Syntrophomonadaceae bacterium]
MFIILRKKTIGLFLSSILFLGFSWGAYNYAAHPNMQNWKEQKIVITDVKTKQKVVSLTFDDGPDPKNTPVVLDVLKKHHTSATFFLVGSRAEDNPALVKRIVDEGHEIGNHSMSHTDYNGKNIEFIRNDIKQCNDVIYKICKQRPELYRPPGGYLSYDLVALTQKEKIKIAYWTYQQDSKDWKSGMKSAQIASHIIKNIKPGQIIILHDGSSNGLESAKALDILIPELNRLGYKFMSMGELIKLGNKE